MLANLVSRTILGILSIAVSAVISLLIQQYLLPFMAQSPNNFPSTSPNSSPPAALPPNEAVTDTAPDAATDVITHPDRPESHPLIQPTAPLPVEGEGTSAIAPEADQENNQNSSIMKEFLEKLNK